MIDFTDYYTTISQKYEITDSDFPMNLSLFLVSNKWFEVTPQEENGRLMVCEEDIKKLEKHIISFCEHYDISSENKSFYLLEQMKSFTPKTASLLMRYIKSRKLNSEITARLIDFLLTFLVGEIPESTDIEIEDLIENGFMELSKAYGDILVDFINWIKSNSKTVYHNVYYMKPYTDNKETNTAYDPYNYFKILYHLYNSIYIDQNDMYAKAAESKNYVDTWLYLALHFLCALRNTDLLRIPHPKLSEPPKKILAQIYEGTFPDDSARSVLFSVIWHLQAMSLTPNKTQGTSGISTIKFNVPASVEVHIGTLFAAAEAHFQIAHNNPQEPLIRVITKYEDITRYMGDEIGDLFLDANFSSRAANKSYMQMIYLLTDDVLGVTDEFHVKGYMFAAMARSHKGSYGDFAQTTSIYLKDAKMSGITPEFVAKELFERGVLSMIPYLLLRMILGEDYEDLTVQNQTKLIQELNLSANEIEHSVALSQKILKRSTVLVKNLYQHLSREELLETLHRIGNGEAVSKQDDCMCLMTAIKQSCPYVGRKNCIGCEYELTYKATITLLLREFYRLDTLCKNAKGELDKARYESIKNEILKPCFVEFLSAIQNLYGQEAVESLEKIMEETR